MNKENSDTYSVTCRCLRLLIFVLVAALVFGAVCVGGACGADVWDGSVDITWDGAGTEANPYLITSAAELAGLAQKVKDGTSYSGKYFKLTTDIDLNNNEWTPIGSANRGRLSGSYSSKKPFAGIFDGGGHIISNMKITTGVGEWLYGYTYGLFGYVTGSITDLSLTDSLIDINGASHSIGTLVGTLDGGKVQDCSVVNSVIRFSDDVDNILGYILGYAAGGVVGENVENKGGTVVAYVNELTNQLPSGNGGWVTGSYVDPIVGKGGTGVVVPDTPEDDKPVLPTSYTLIASVVGGHGNISYPGNTSVTPTQSFTYTFIPDAGYVVDTVLVDNVDDTAVADNVTSKCLTVLGYTMNYTIPNIMNNYTISVSYKYSPKYFITIPAYLIIKEDTKSGAMDVTVSELWIPENEAVAVMVKSEDNFNLTHVDYNYAKLPYNLFAVESNTRVTNNMEIARFTMTDFLKKQSQSQDLYVTLNGTITELPPMIGTYNGNLTFTANYITA